MNWFESGRGTAKDLKGMAHHCLQDIILPEKEFPDLLIGRSHDG
jgi:hypothetical protein